MRRSVISCVVLILCLFLLTCGAFSQIPSGSIKGIVTDPLGAVHPNISVEIKSKTKGIAKSIMTNTDGEYAATGLPPGVYEVSSRSVNLVYKNENVVITGAEITRLDFTISYEANCAPDPAGKTLELTAADRRDIISSVLVDALIDHNIPDYDILLKQKGAVVLSLETINAEWVKSPSNIVLTLMNKREIKERANQGGDYLYLSFSDWKIGASCVVITLSNSWMVADDSVMGYLSGGGNTYLYKKENGKWEGKTIGGWIS